MTVFSNLPEVMEQNPSRARNESQFSAAQIAAVATVTSSLLRKAMLNVSSLSTKARVRALHTQRDLTQKSLHLTTTDFQQQLKCVRIQSQPKDVLHAAAQGPMIILVPVRQNPFWTVSMDPWLTSHCKMN